MPAAASREDGGLALSAEGGGLVLTAALGVGSDGSVSEDVAVVVRGDEIARCTRPSELTGEERALPRLGGRDRVLIPGLVNAHQHGHWGSGLLAGTADAPLEEWLVLAEAEPAPEQRDAATLAALRQLRTGTTTAVHLHSCRRESDPARLEARLAGYADAHLSVAMAIGHKTRWRLAYESDETFLARLPEELRRDVMAELAADDLTLDHLDADGFERILRHVQSGLAADDDRVRLLLGPPGPHWLRDADLERMGALAAELDLAVHVHVLESALEAAVARAEHGGSTVAHLDRHGLLGARTSLAHFVHAGETDVRLAREREAMVVVNAGSNLRLRNGAPPIARIEREGIAWALGTDSQALDDRDDLLAEARLAMGLAGGTVDSAGAWRALSERGARVADMGRAGRVAEGCRADLVLLDLADLLGPAPAEVLESPTDAAALVLRRGRAESIDVVVAAGRVVVEGGRCVDHDVAEMEGRVREAVRGALGDSRRRRELARRVVAHQRQAHARWR